jgi:hypothetical protein
MSYSKCVIRLVLTNFFEEITKIRAKMKVIALKKEPKKVSVEFM